MPGVGERDQPARGGGRDAERDQVQQATGGEDANAHAATRLRCARGSGTGRGQPCRAASDEFSWYEVAFISLGGPCTWFQVLLPAYEDLLRR